MFVRRDVLLIYALLLAGICLTVTGELLLKVGMTKVGAFAPTPAAFLRTFTQWQILLGFAFIFSGALFWLGVISRVDFSFAYPLLAISYIVSLIPAHFILQETITPNRIIGTIIIVIGVIVITWQNH